MAKKEKKSGGRERQECKLEMTPMIDVTFLLIIFFLCLRFRTLEGKLTAFLPKDIGVTTQTAEPIPKIDVRIYLDQNHKGSYEMRGQRKIWSNRKVYWRVQDQVYHNLRDLEAGLKKFRQMENPKTPGKPLPVAVHAYDGVFYGEVTQTVDLLISKQIGFEEVTFAGGRTSAK